MIIAIANCKGGVGKTTTAINLASNLALIYNKKTLMIDADPSRNLSIFFNKYDEKRDGLPELLRFERYKYPKAVKKLPKRTKYKHLDIIQSKKALNDIDQIQENYIEALEYYKENYDYVIIDCHPDFSTVTKAMLMAADRVIVPIKVDRNALNGLELMQEAIDEVEILKKQKIPCAEPIELKVLITMYQNNKITNSLIQELIKKTEYPIFNSVIRNTCRCSESIEKGKPLIRCASKSTACQDYLSLVKEMLKGEL
jgi:chromosome partitioning protein